MNESDILEKFQPYGFDEVEIVKMDKTQVLFELTHQYDWNEDGDEEMKKNLQEITSSLGFVNYDVYDDISIGGCDTCDYGSKYGFAIRMWN